MQKKTFFHISAVPKGTKNGTSGGQIKNLKTLSWIVHLLCIFLRFLALLDNFSHFKISRIASHCGGFGVVFSLGERTGSFHLLLCSSISGSIDIQCNVVMLEMCCVCFFSGSFRSSDYFQVGSFPRTNPMHVA